jgi:hypothetical protein
MELHTLRCFVGVADQLSFSRACEPLNLSQPALSRQVRALEDELRMPLFDERNWQRERASYSKISTRSGAERKICRMARPASFEWAPCCRPLKG